MISEAFAGTEAIAQHIAAINDKGSFTEFARGVLDSRELVQFFVLLGAGFCGATANYLYKWMRDEITGSLIDYVFKQYPKRTLLALATYFSYCVTITLSPMLDGSGWSAVINLGFTTGFAIDALVNKSGRKEWSAEERAVRADPAAPEPPKT